MSKNCAKNCAVCVVVVLRIKTVAFLTFSVPTPSSDLRVHNYEGTTDRTFGLRVLEQTDGKHPSSAIQGHTG